jgi:hypothetical protein
VRSWVGRQQPRQTAAAGTQQLWEKNVEQLRGGVKTHEGLDLETHRPSWQGAQSVVPL